MSIRSRSRDIRARPQHQQSPHVEIDVIEISDDDDGSEEIRANTGASCKNKRNNAANPPVSLSHIATPQAVPSQPSSKAGNIVRDISSTKADGLSSHPAVKALTDSTNTGTSVQVVASARPATPMDVDAPPPPPTQTTNSAESINVYLALVLEVVPDVEPQFARDLIEGLIARDAENIGEQALHRLFEDANYPKVAKSKGKRKRTDDADEPDAKRVEKAVRIDYASTDRPFSGGAHYKTMALVGLI